MVALILIEKELMYMKKHIETTISEELIFTGKVFTVKVLDNKMENGKIGKREIVYHNGGAGVLAVDDENYVYLIKQFRSPFNEELIEIPAGKLDIGEDPFEAAKRELLEETGLVAGEYVSLGEVYPTVGFCSEKLYIYLARDIEIKEQKLDEDEFVTLFKVSMDEAVKMCYDGRIKDSKSLVAILKAKEILGM